MAQVAPQSNFTSMGWFYRLAYNVVGFQLSLHRIKVEGRENVPTGGFLIVANHVSFMDPTTVGWAVERELHYLARKSLFKPPFWSWFLPVCNVLPIDRDGGQDLSGLRRIIRMLKEGHAVLIFPEGTRSPDGTIQAPIAGAGLIALKGEVPVLPVRIFGTFESLSKDMIVPRFHPIRVVIGKPYLPTIPPGTKARDAHLPVAQEMMDRIAALG